MSIRFYRKFEKCHVKVDDSGIYGKFEIERDIRHYQGALWHIKERTLIGLLKPPEYEEFTMKWGSIQRISLFSDHLKIQSKSGFKHNFLVNLLYPQKVAFKKAVANFARSNKIEIKLRQPFFGN